MKKQKANNRIFNEKEILKKLLLSILMVSILIICIPSFSLAEGSSADLFLTLSRSPLNIGKTFTLTLKISPNSSLSITTFEALIQYDTSKFEIVKNSSGLYYTKPSSVPSGYEMNANLSGNSIIILCIDNSQTSPINTKGNDTSLISFTFKVKDNASLGTASFVLKDCVVNQNTSQGPVEIPTTASSPKTVQVAARLETNAYLSSITTDLGALTPDFSKTTTKYKIEVPMEQTSISISAKTESALAKLSITGGKTLKYGDNTVTIKVTAQDTDIVKTYTIIVNRLSPEATPTQEIVVTQEPTPIPTVESTVVTPTTAISTSSQDLTPNSTEIDKWKNIAIIFMGLFIVALVTIVWLIIERINEHKKVVKIRRV